MSRIANVIGFDDAPFAHAHRGDVPLVGVVCAGTRMDGLVVGRVRRDGANSTRVMTALVKESRFREHIRGVMMMGIAVAGFNVVDIHALADALGLPVLVVARRPPDLARIHAALVRVRGGARKAALLEKAGPMEPCGGLLVQRAGLDLDAAAGMIAATTLQGRVPEPVRLAHLVAGGLGRGESRGGA